MHYHGGFTAVLCTPECVCSACGACMQISMHYPDGFTTGFVANDEVCC